MKSLLQRFRRGLKRSTPTFHRAFERLGSLMQGGRLDAAVLEELEEGLYEADLGPETVEEIIEAIRRAAKRNPQVTIDDLKEAAYGVLTEVMAGSTGGFEPDPEGLEVVVILGVNGSGKTTTTAKLAKLYQDSGHRVVVGACDTFRAAANEQLKEWSARLGLDLISSQQGADAAAVAYDAMQAALKREAGILLLDTAGRLHTKEPLMRELQKIRRVLEKQDENAPQHAWLVVDGSLGSNSIEQARVFNEMFGLTGLIITKLDGTSRGGALVSIYRELEIPIYYVGLGEKPEDLQPFSEDEFVRALLEMEAGAEDDEG